MNLNEELNRIKSMMKSITEDEFKLPELDDNQKKIVRAIMSSFQSKPKFYDSDYDLNGGWFMISLGENTNYLLEFHFDVSIESRSQYYPGSYDEPPSGEPAEFRFDISSMKLMVNDEIVYNGDDVTDFLNIPVQMKGYRNATGFDALSDHVDDRLQEYESESDYDGPEYDD
jgi:hypothetical protein